MSTVKSAEKELMARRREAKLALELRNNLRRRKTQSRARDDDGRDDQALDVIVSKPDVNPAQ